MLESKKASSHQVGNLSVPSLTRFPSHPGEFQVSQLSCDNPQCPCEEMILHFKEVQPNPQTISPPLSFSLRIDINTWTEKNMNSCEHNPLITKLAHEFLSELSSEAKQQFKQGYLHAKKHAKRLWDYQINAKDLREGFLVSYIDITSETGGITSGGDCCSFQFKHHHKEYLVEDLYCPNPSCDCQQTHLNFFEYRPLEDGSFSIHDGLIAKINFQGKAVVIDPIDMNSKKAEQVLANWKKQYWNAEIIEVLQTRYDQIKEVGERNLKKNQETNQAPPQSLLLNVGRNEGCPCGSGKKYKKCCGKTRMETP